MPPWNLPKRRTSLVSSKCLAIPESIDIPNSSGFSALHDAKVEPIQPEGRAPGCSSAPRLVLLISFPLWALALARNAHEQLAPGSDRTPRADCSGEGGNSRPGGMI